MASANLLSDDRHVRGLRFVRRIYVPRIIGMATGGLAVAAVFWTNQVHPVLWLFLGLATLVWPHVAYGIGLASRDPHRTEIRHLMADSAIGGACIALMNFNLMPSIILFTSLSMDKFAVGGLSFFLRCTLVLVATCVGVAWVVDSPIRVETSFVQMMFSLPHMITYPVVIAITTNNLVRRMNYQRRQLEAMSRTDGLSQLPNRQTWEAAAAEEFEVSRHSGTPASVLILDIDSLQGVNEDHGYPTGDEVIRSVAAIVKHAIREADLPGRYGGEEFAVLMPGIDGIGALRVANKIRAGVSSSVLEKSARLRGTVSIGVAEIQESDDSFRAWVAHAEEALSSAKRRGGNRAARYAPIFQRTPEPAIAVPPTAAERRASAPPI